MELYSKGSPFPPPSLPLAPILLSNLGEVDLQDLLLRLQEEYLVRDRGFDQEEENEEYAPLLPFDGDPLYGESINATLSFYFKDRQFAASRLKKCLHFKPDADFPDLVKKLEALIRQCKQEERELEKIILELANRQPVDQLMFAHHHAITIGNALKRWELVDVCRQVVHKDCELLFQKMNPYLKDEDVELLKKSAIDFMVTQTNRMQINKVLEPISSYLTNDDETLLDLAAYELSQIRAYNPKNDPFALLFEYTSGLRLRMQQAQIIQLVLPLLADHPHIPGIAFQAMMNSGKSSVVISTLVEIASEVGLISCVFSHYSQLSAMKGNLQTYQKTRFKKDLLFLPYQLKDLGDVKILEIIKNRLVEAKRKRCGLIMKATFPQIVQIKFILDCFRLKGVHPGAKVEYLQYLKQLAEINLLFEKDIVSFIDECDLILNLMTEVNVPFGDSKTISPERVDLVAAIYLILVQPQIRDKLKLHKDRQKGLQPEELINEIFPLVAEELFQYSTFELKNHLHLKEAFKRHLQEAITYEDQFLADDLRVSLESIQDPLQKDNVELLRLMESRSKSHDRYEKEAAEAFGLTRHMFLSVLPKVFSKSFNRNYGPLNPEHPNGEIIPYQGPDAPAKTRFGYVYLCLAAHLQAALGGGIAQDEIRFLASKMLIAAHSFANQEKISLLDTVEAKQFYALTGITLNEAVNPQKLTEAHRYVNHPDYPERCLKVRQEVAPFHVRYYPQYASSNPINFIEHLPRPIACSGTKWNSSSFHPKVGMMFPDEGSEGAIINAIEERDSISPCVHGVPNASLTALLAVIRKHPKKSRIRSIIDGGGFLKDCKRGVTQAQFRKGGIHPNVVCLLEFFQEEPDTEIEGVVYLHRFSEEEIEEGVSEEAFVIAKRGERLPLILENTTPDAIAKAGIPLARLFFLIEEMLGTGLDCKMAPDTICLQTIDLDLPMRTVLQNSQRARDFFKKQHIDYCILNEGIEKVLGGDKSMEVIDRLLMTNEAEMISDLTLRSYILQLPNIPRAYAIRELLTAATHLDAEKIHSLTDQFSDYLLSSRGEEKLWVSFGRIERPIPVVAFLTMRSSQFHKELTEINEQVSSKFAERAKSLLEDAEKEKKLPSYVKTRESEKLDNEVELIHEEEIELDLDKDLSINEELNQELNCYHEIGGNSPCYKEKQWELENKTTLSLRDLLENIKPVKTVFQTMYPVPGRTPVTTAEYAECFEKELYMTVNLEHVYVIATPLLHKDTKPVDFLLIVKEKGECSFILVSKKDAGYFKEWILQNRPVNAWLVNLEGIPEAEESPGCFMKVCEKNLRFKNKIQDGLWQANFYQGNIRYLEDQYNLSLQKINGRKKLFGKYLALKNAFESRKLPLTSRSFLVDTKNFVTKKESGLLFSSRREQMKKTYIEYQRFSRKQVEKIDPGLVMNLGPQQIPWLISKEQVSNLYYDAVNALVPEQVGLINDNQIKYLTNPALIVVLPADKVKHLDKEQVVSLGTAEQVNALPDRYLNSISPKCVKFIEARKIGILRHDYLIKEIQPEQISHVLESQVPHLDKREQIEALPDRLINAIKPNQVQMLPYEKIPLLTKEEQISNIPTENVKYVTQEQVFALIQNQVQAIPTERVDLIQKIPLNKVTWLLNHHVPVSTREQAETLGEGLIDAIVDEQFEWLKDEQLSQLRRKELIEKIPAQKMNFITAIQVPSLIESQIKALPDNLLNYLEPDQITFIENDKICLLVKDSLIAAVSPKKLPAISKLIKSLI